MDELCLRRSINVNKICNLLCTIYFTNSIRVNKMDEPFESPLGFAWYLNQDIESETFISNLQSQMFESSAMWLLLSGSMANPGNNERSDDIVQSSSRNPLKSIFVDDDDAMSNTLSEQVLWRLLIKSNLLTEQFLWRGWETQHGLLDVTRSIHPRLLAKNFSSSTCWSCL